MVKIEEGKELIMENVLSIRKKMTNEEIQNCVKKIDEFLKKNDLKMLSDIIITTIFSAEVVNGKQYFDTEIMVPINRLFHDTDKYKYKDIFAIKNCLYHRHLGDPQRLRDKFLYIGEYIKKNRYQQISNIYTVHKNKDKYESSVNKMQFDCYVSVFENIL